MYEVMSLCWLPDGKGFVSGGMDGKVQAFDLGGNVLFRLPHTPSRVVGLAVTPDGKRIITVGRVDVKPSGSSSTASVASRASSLTGTPGSNVQPRHEKRMSVYDVATRQVV